MKLKQLILSLVAFLLVGCASESMITLSEENQSIIEEKTQAREGNGSESATESSQNDEEVPEADSVNEVENVLTEFDTSSWQILEDTSQLALVDYLPNTTYQIKQYSNGATSRVDYPNYLDEALQLMQVESRLDNGDPTVSFYSWGNSQIVKLSESTELNPYINHLSEITSQENQDSQLLLQAPLAVGTSWQRNASTTSAITNVFSQAQLPAGELSNVIEVTSTSQAGELKEYYAQGEGLVATVEADQNGSITQVWQAQAIYHENRIVNEVAVTLPTKDEDMIEAGQATFKWQTNGSLTNAFDEMFKEMNIINDTITIQSVAVEDGVVLLDFTPGVVAVLNSYDAPEQAVIASIVTTLGNFFNTEQVRLSVSGNGMLPDTIEYPTNGIYDVSTVTQTMEAIQEESSSESNASIESSNDSLTTDESQAQTTSGSIQ